MPLPSLHPLPANPRTGQQPLATLGGRGISEPPPASASGGGGVSREVLKGLQDVVWSDDEDDPDCLLCAEALDLSDLNFKPCQCGLQICQFCYNKLLGSDARCPGCRRPYDAKAVVFQPVDFEEVKRAKEKKTRRAKTIKQLSSMGRRHLLGVRIIMKNMVYVVGMKLPALGDEAIPILRSNEYFGQYGKISKLYLSDRTTVSSTSVPTLDLDDLTTSTGIYVIYIRREDAARAISALDGIPTPQGSNGQILRASYGTARYCDAFLRGSKCDNSICHHLHEWGGESDCFTKDDMEIALLRPHEYDARQKLAALQAPTLAVKATWSRPPPVEDPIGSALPNSAGWGKNVGAGRVAIGRVPTAPTAVRAVKVNGLVPLKSNATFPLPTPSPINPAPLKVEKEKRKGTTGASMARGLSADSRQSTPASSAQTSPKRRSSALPIAVAGSAVPTALSAVISPPGIPIESAFDSLDEYRSVALASPSDEPQEESVSAESEAGPSSNSPAPRTPSRRSTASRPPPLTEDPILIHSPYEEPQIVVFPASDPAFAYVLDVDESEVERQQAQPGAYRPSPFSKMLVGLAQLGILAPELPDFITSPLELDAGGFTSTFQPFGPTPEVESIADPETLAGPSRTGPEGVEEGPRMASRFDFARPSSRSNGQGQSPFASLRRPVEEPTLARDTWSGRQHHPEDLLLPQQSGDSRAGALAAQAANFASHYGTSGQDHVWGADPAYLAQASYSLPSGSLGRDERGNERRRTESSLRGGLAQGGKDLRADRDDFEPGHMRYSTASSAHTQRSMFSPDTSTHSPFDEGPFHASQAYNQLHASQHTPAQLYPDARTLQQFHQQRVPSPSPLGSHGYRRF